jgi:hypothetical protein
MIFGWKEGRDPTPDFSVRAYLAAFPEVEAGGINPFVHYLTSGRPRALAPEPVLGFRHEVIERLVPIETRIAAATAGEVAAAPRAELDQALAVSRGGLARLHVTLSHDDFTANVGGLQLAIQREAARLAAEGRDHLQPNPAKPLTGGAHRRRGPRRWASLERRAVGPFAQPPTQSPRRSRPRARARARSFAIHRPASATTASETRHHPGRGGLAVRGLPGCTTCQRLRGFPPAAQTTSWTAPPRRRTAAACGICLYGSLARRHMPSHAALFDALEADLGGALAG